MSPIAQSPEARRSLQQLSSPHALDFCARLLARSVDGMLGFRDFVAAARALIDDKPEDGAVYLAALIALDMGATENEWAEAMAPPRSPSKN